MFSLLAIGQPAFPAIILDSNVVIVTCKSIVSCKQEYSYGNFS
jgi:hypothetical protein